MFCNCILKNNTKLAAYGKNFVAQDILSKNSVVVKSNTLNLSYCINQCQFRNIMLNLVPKTKSFLLTSKSYCQQCVKQFI